VDSLKPRAIIFDIGRVLVRVDVGRAMRALGSGLSMSPAELWAAIERDPRWPDWQDGRISARDWHLHISRRLGISLTFEQFADAWNQALDPEPMQDDALFVSLKKNHRLGLLSNTDPIHVAYMEANFAFFRHFPKGARIYSCESGASKPSPLLYLEALRACKVQSKEAIFIDDLAENVDAARSLGIAGIHYQGREKLMDALRQLGVEVSG
jgi:HAD superfamily hydrolase (TIGR01509 family)